ncbi:E3 ubiquitin-protein ligase AIRP2-like isoform X1 [Nymphaea colorata]|nr:E3 ubiquitin-protein ligase AIRP2-like isoform X1 [Nymphaea colorata]
MLQKLQQKSSYKETLKALEADIQHANTLAASIPGGFDGACLQMRLSYSPIAPIVLFLIEWMDFSFSSCLGLLHILIYKVYVDGRTTISAEERKASLKEFYAVIYPSLQQLEADYMELEDNKQRARCKERLTRKRIEERRKLSDLDLEREDECGICMETCGKVVLPNCGHAMCIKCFRDWNTRSKSCPFCRDSLKRVNSRDLWVLTSSSEVIDTTKLAKENLRQLYVYIQSLPLIMPESLFFVYDYTI